ncbi:MAG: hypothetical protein OFPII_04290 [Osedax symbiont Rs1]|nr:MAG: hypothetical protein OFPII_04290 [Osedax symbiont Rs1]
MFLLIYVIISTLVFFLGADSYIGICFVGIGNYLFYNREFFQTNSLKLSRKTMIPDYSIFIVIYTTCLTMSAALYYINIENYSFLSQGVYSTLTGSQCLYSGNAYVLFIVSKLTLINILLTFLLLFPFIEKDLLIKHNFAKQRHEFLTKKMSSLLLHSIAICTLLYGFFELMVCSINLSENDESNVPFEFIFESDLYSYIHPLVFGFFTAAICGGLINIVLIRLKNKREF